MDRKKQKELNERKAREIAHDLEGCQEAYDGAMKMAEYKDKVCGRCEFTLEFRGLWNVSVHCDNAGDKTIVTMSKYE